MKYFVEYLLNMHFLILQCKNIYQLQTDDGKKLQCVIDPTISICEISVKTYREIYTNKKFKKKIRVIGRISDDDRMEIETEQVMILSIDGTQIQFAKRKFIYGYDCAVNLITFRKLGINFTVNAGRIYMD